MQHETQGTLPTVNEPEFHFKVKQFFSLLYFRLASIQEDRKKVHLWTCFRCKRRQRCRQWLPSRSDTSSWMELQIVSSFRWKIWAPWTSWWMHRKAQKEKDWKSPTTHHFQRGNFAVSFREYISASESMWVLFWKIPALGRWTSSWHLGVLRFVDDSNIFPILFNMVYGLTFVENCGLNEDKVSRAHFLQNKFHINSFVMSSALEKKKKQNHGVSGLVQAMAHLEEKRRELLEVFWPIFFLNFWVGPKRLIVTIY